MIGNLIVRFKKVKDLDIYEGEFIVGIDDESNLESYINNCLEDIVAHISGEGVDSTNEIFNLEYYFEELTDNELENETDIDLVYDWR